MRRELAAIVGLLLPTVVAAQAETTGRITGTVFDEGRIPIAGAAVTIESPTLPGPRRTSSDSNGRFLAPLLPPGVYTVIVSAPTTTPRRWTFRVGAGQVVPLEAELSAGPGPIEDVTILAPATRLETTAGGEDFDYGAEIDRLPIPDRSLENVATLAPSVSFGLAAGTVTISGAPSFDNSILLDGSEISDPYSGVGALVYIEEAIDEVRVVTGGVSAKYGRFQGGVVSATTKSGGNTFAGTIRADFAKESWNSQTPFGEYQSDTLDETYSATFGGPILKDRLWFFLGARTVPTTETPGATLFAPGVFVTERDEDRWQAKLTATATANHVIQANYAALDDASRGRADLPAGDLFAASGFRDDSSDVLAFGYQGVLSDRMFLDVQVARKRVSIRSGGDSSLGSPFLEGLPFNPGLMVFHNHWWDYNDASVRDADEASAEMTHVLRSGSWGNHTLEYGIQYANSITAGEYAQSPTGFNLLNYDFGEFARCTDGTDCTFQLISAIDGGFTYRWQAVRFTGDQEIQNLAAFLQDSWEIGKWRLDAGLRYEDWHGTGPFGALDLDFRDWSPRLGANYNVTPEWQLQASWGKYVSRFNDRISGSVAGIGSAPHVVSLYTGPTSDPAARLSYDEVEAILRDDANWNVTVAVSDPRQPTRAFAPGASAPYAYDTNVSVKRALPRNTGTVTLTYTSRRYDDLLEDFVGGQGVVTVVDPFGSGATTDFDFRSWDNCDRCEREYDDLVATVDYRPSARWGLGGNYTYSRTRGNYEGETGDKPATGSIIGNYERTLVSGDPYPFGYLGSDVRHRARVWANRRFDFGRAGSMTLGGIVFYRSGAGYSKVATVPAGTDPAPDYGGAPTAYTAYFDGRGNDRFDGYWSVDATIRYDVALWRDLTAWMKLDVLNLTDEDTLISHRTDGIAVTDDEGVRTWIPRFNFGTARSELDYQGPRSYFLSVGLTF